MMNMMGWGYGLMAWIGMMLVPAAIILVVIFIVLKLIMNNNNKNETIPSNALRILDERFARGEIDEEEYKEKKALILKR